MPTEKPEEEAAEEADVEEEAEEDDVERRMTFRGQGCAIQPAGFGAAFFFVAAGGALVAGVGGITYVLRSTSSRLSENTRLMNSYASSICDISRAPVIIT